MKRFLKILMPLVIAALLGCFAWWGYSKLFPETTSMVFKTEKVSRADISSTIGASGTVEPEELVNVGAQVSGKIMSFGTDADGHPVDYRSKVKAGMTLAQIDDVLYAAELRERKAEKLQAEASIVTAQATIKQAKAKQMLAERNWVRAQELYAKKAMAKSDYDSAEAAYISSQADTGAAEASLEQARAQLAIAEAALVKAQRNMDYCVITSPVDGIIIDRRVSIGQTVVSNMSAYSIFLIAKEFKKMQVWVSVNEADIGSIHPGMAVTFTVDAFPGVEFRGTVRKIRLNATMSQNVVTYIVEVDTDNADGKLLPYLTANVKFIRAERKNVLTVSNAALRFTPDPSLVVPEFRSLQVSEGKRRVWVDGGNNLLRPLEVTIGLNTGARVEILSGELKEGDAVVFGAAEVKADTAARGEAKSPFMPEPPKRLGTGSAANRERSKQQGPQ